MTKFTRVSARKWMELESYNWEYNTSTELAEACAAAFDKNEVGGPLDDPDHWIWEVALEVIPTE